MSAADLLMRLSDVDLLMDEFADAAAVARLRRLGFEPPQAGRLGSHRARLAALGDPGWLARYERVRRRYCSAVVPVRDRICLGCFVTLPTSISRPGDGEPLGVCESCGRILYWG